MLTRPHLPGRATARGTCDDGNSLLRYSYEGQSFRYASASSATRAVGTDGAKAVLEAAGSRYRDVDSLGSCGGALDEGVDGGAGDVIDSTAEAQNRTRYLNAGGRTIGESGSRGNLSYTLDRLGSVRRETGADGQSQSYEYDAYGASIGQTDPATFGYTGKPVDPLTGVYDYGYRNYAPAVARFTTVDPIRDGSNWYAYVNGDPVNLVDPNGLVAADAAAAGTGVAPEDPVHGIPYASAVDQTQNYNLGAPEPVGEDGNPSPPPVPVPYAGPNVGWRPVKGTAARPTKWIPEVAIRIPEGRGGQPAASWDPEGHWDIKPGDGGETQHHDPDGKRLTPEEAHSTSGHNEKSSGNAGNSEIDEDLVVAGSTAIGAVTAIIIGKKIIGTILTLIPEPITTGVGTFLLATP